MNTGPGEMPKERKQKVLEAAIREFAEKGYAAASTNVIASAAGVAKGLIFHYFDSKKDLYLTALSHCLETQMEYFLARAKPPHPPDIIERVIEWGALKLEMTQRFPHVHRLLLNAVLDAPSDVKAESDKLLGAFSERSWKLFLEGVDFSRLRDDIDKRKALELVVVCMEGLQQRYVERFRDRPDELLARAEEVYEEVKEYMEIMRYGLYKRPGKDV